MEKLSTKNNIQTKIIEFLSGQMLGSLKMFFQSMLYSGKLLEIKTKDLGKKLNQFTPSRKRVSGMFKISGNISSDILKWFDEKENEFSKDISAAEIFDFHKDQKAKNALSKRENNFQKE